MNHQEYVRIIEKELQRINKIIDHKIIHGEEYIREARDHKLLLRKMRLHSRRSVFGRFVPSVFQF